MSTEFIIKNLCLEHFDGVGLASVGRPLTLSIYEQWLSEGFHGEMSYLKRHLSKKANPQELLPNARSWIALTLHYDTDEPLSVDLASEMRSKKMGWVARYARGGDYHEIISRKHKKIISKLSEKFPGEKFLGCVDAQAVLERDLGSAAGLGWVGKNTCLIDRGRGSFFFISEILTTLELLADKPVADHCGTCSRCIDACPTGAIEEPRQLNATKCISYWTIESKVSAPPSLASRFGQNIFGCDICQDVCPWNQKARKTLPRPPSSSSGLVDLVAFSKLSDDEIKKMTENSALSRAKPQHLRENALVALKNCSE